MPRKVKTKSVTNEDLASAIDSLARITAKGFEHTATKVELRNLESRMDKIEKKLEALTETVQNLVNKLAHYIDLHEERYLDLKHRYKLLAKWAEKVASKTGIPFEFEE